MVPGYAKPREELPWLPYQKSDKVFVINSHNLKVPWTPASIATALWLDAADSSTLFDAASGGSVVVADGEVARWQDKSGNARHATQSTLLNRPVRKVSVQNGLDVVRFDGSNDSMSGASRVVANNAKACFCVARSTNAVGGTLLQNGSGAVRYHVFRMLRLASTNFVMGDTITTNVTIGFNFSTVIQSSFISSSVIDSSLGTAFWLNGTSYATSSGVLSETGASGYRVGELLTSSPVQPWPGDISELIVLDENPTTDRRQTIEGYLAHKWGLATILPNDHPYKSVAP
jgi:hypothetical protein